MYQRLAFVLFSAFVLAWLVGGADATGWRKTSNEVALLNQRIQGKVIDHTANSGVDLRIWSRSLGQRRDLYVYLPPNFDPHLRYPLMIALHGNGFDEQSMLRLLPQLDKAIAAGELAPMIVAMPDGSFAGEPGFNHPGTFFINSNLGDFEDFVLNDVWDFLMTHYPLRPERNAHILSGVSMGGFAAYSIGIRHRYCFGTVVGMFPPLNLRWMDDCGNYLAKFDPHHWGWRTRFDHPREVLGSFSGGLVPMSVKKLVMPLFDSAEIAISEISRLNPIELIERTCLRNGELNMYVGYGAHDEFNIDAQVESFLYMCKFRQIYVGVGYDPDGHHDTQTAYRLTPGMLAWLGPRLAMYNTPCGVDVPTHAVARPYVAKRQTLPATNGPAPQPKIPNPPTPTPAPSPSPADLPGPPPGSDGSGEVEETPAPSVPPSPPPAGPPTTARPTGASAVTPIPRRADLGPTSGPPVSPGPSFTPNP